MAGGATCAFAILAMPAMASTFKVNATVDAVDAMPGNGACATAKGKCTLRAAIQEANAWPGLDVVKVPKGLYRLTLTGNNEPFGATGDLNIRHSIRIEGAGPYLTVIDGNICEVAGSCPGEGFSKSTDRVLSISNDRGPVAAFISGVGIQNGGGRDVFAGGIYIGKTASLTLVRSRVSNNRAHIFGGGIANAGFLVVSESEIEFDTLPAKNLGGLTDSGGGIYNFTSGTAQIDRSSISNNEAARGGGIKNSGGRLTITNSTINRNKATASCVIQGGCSPLR